VVGGKISLKKKFVLFLDSKRYRRAATGARGQLADGGGPGRSFVLGRPGRFCCCGRRCLAAFHLFPQAGCDIRVSRFLFFIQHLFYSNIFLLNLN
jgi:hypothetical protein